MREEAERGDQYFHKIVSMPVDTSWVVEAPKEDKWDRCSELYATWAENVKAKTKESKLEFDPRAGLVEAKPAQKKIAFMQLPLAMQRKFINWSCEPFFDKGRWATNDALRTWKDLVVESSRQVGHSPSDRTYRKTLPHPAGTKRPQDLV